MQRLQSRTTTGPPLLATRSFLPMTNRKSVCKKRPVIISRPSSTKSSRVRMVAGHQTYGTITQAADPSLRRFGASSQPCRLDTKKKDPLMWKHGPVRWIFTCRCGAHNAPSVCWSVGPSAKWCASPMGVYESVEHYILYIWVSSTRIIYIII